MAATQTVRCKRGGQLLIALIIAVAVPAVAQVQHDGFSQLLADHVQPSVGGHSSRVNYRALKEDSARLDRYLTVLSAVSPAQYAAFDRREKLAFLINAYNAFTLRLVLDHYPGITSIKDIGGWFSSPWKLRFIPLLGDKLSLDDIEHQRLREPGVFDDPRIHFAVNCASVGCPSLREEAYTAAALDRQLDDQAQRFMSDRSRNRYNPQRQRLEVSKIFDWYEDDFTRGYRGHHSLKGFLAGFSQQLADEPSARNAIREKQLSVSFTDYDWRLNDSQ